MITAIGVLLVVMALSVTAFAAANGDIRFSSTNHDQREAYSAAEAGVADFLFRLSRDPDFWGRCDGAAAPAKISQAWNGVGADPRKWRALDGTRASYAIETIPAKGYSTCDPNVPLSMMDPDTGTFSIRATGKVISGGKEVKRSVIATFKRKNFLDFIYFTDLESQDPVLWEKLIGCTGTTPSSEVTPPCAQVRTGDPSIGAWGAAQCGRYWRDGRGNNDYPGRVRWTSSGTYNSYPVGCTEIVFASGEFIRGPFHTNDGMYISNNNGGYPTFGRRKSDIIEVSAGKTQEPYRPSGATLDIKGTWAPGAPKLDPPPSNASLKKDATLVYDGPTKIVLNSSGTMTVTNKNVSSTISQPTSGVIYVGTSGACTPYDPFVPKVADGKALSGCGDLAISGVYTKNLTFAADNDLVIVDDLTKAAAPNDSVLGLIANNFVRVAHQSVFDTNGVAAWSNGLSGSARRMGPECRTTSTATQNIKIDAAILALNHSFTVDRYGCGSHLGDLQVHGAIAQKHRGVVGIVGTTGFNKMYTYDDRLRFRTPPKFLDPVNTAWHVARQVEQSPAT
jgi:hypothetical protein